ncbi:MAG: Glucuronokinase 1, partial [Solirubrobacterales bacterium]|nr:Glucuronokinase 1 [Solirubrobacterales bacterium]
MTVADAGASVRVAIPARAALAGNPSDGYGGAVLAVCVDGLAATVQVAPAPRDIVEPDECSALVGATVRRFRTVVGAAAGAPVAVHVASTIPREVGLAGSSAIVLATLRALGALTGTGIAEEELAAVALDVEVSGLGIAAGPQDRVVQARGGLVAMDFAAGGLGVAAPLDPGGLPPLLLGWLASAGQASGGYHADLRAR